MQEPACFKVTFYVWSTAELLTQGSEHIDVSFKYYVAQGTYHTWDVSYKGCMIQEKRLITGTHRHGILESSNNESLMTKPGLSLLPLPGLDEELGPDVHEL